MNNIYNPTDNSRPVPNLQVKNQLCPPPSRNSLAAVSGPGPQCAPSLPPPSPHAHLVFSDNLNAAFMARALFTASPRRCKDTPIKCKALDAALLPP